MRGGEGSGSWGVVARRKGSVAALHLPATGPGPAVAVAADANGGCGNGAAGKGGSVAAKVKVTVSVRGHWWTSARHLDEKLEEFAAAVERNARRLRFVDEGDRIQRLQLAYGDGSEPEDLDVDATLGDVIICMGNKRLVAIVHSIETTPAAGLLSKDTTARPPQTSNINGPPEAPPSQFQPVDRSCSLHPDYVPGASASLPPLPSSNGKRSMSGACKPVSGPSTVQQQHFSSLRNPTPSPAELADMVVRSSSHRMQGPGVQGGSAPTTTRSPATPPLTADLESFTSALACQLRTLPEQIIECWHATSLSSELLAQFLEFMGTFSGTAAAHHTQAACRDPKASEVTSPVAYPVTNSVANADKATIFPPCNLQSGKEDPSCNLQSGKKKPPDQAGHESKGLPNDTDVANAKRSVSAGASHEKSKEKSSSSNVHDPLAPQSGDGDGVDSELPNGGSELVFPVKRRCKTRLQGVGGHLLKMSDFSPYFHLTEVNAAKKLGVSLTTLKKALRDLGLYRWPGRKVRSLESTIHGLEHTIAVGQGAGLGEFNEISKLQQEMDKLVHGTPAQVTRIMQSPSLRTAEIYKRLYSYGWRSKSHSAACHEDTLDTENPAKRTRRGSRSGLGGMYRFWHV